LNKGHGKPVDWWCLGILVYEMIAGIFLFFFFLSIFFFSGIDPFNDEDPMAIY
jgi:protein kinase X